MMNGENYNSSSRLKRKWRLFEVYTILLGTSVRITISCQPLNLGKPNYWNFLLDKEIIFLVGFRTIYIL